MHQFFIKKFLEQNYKTKLKSEMILQQILALQGPKVGRKKSVLYQEYWKERGKEQEKMKKEGGVAMNVADLLKNVLGNKNAEDVREEEEAQKRAAEKQEENKNKTVKIMNSVTFDDLVNKISIEYKKKQ